jgi:predicted porin
MRSFFNGNKSWLTLAALVACAGTAGAQSAVTLYGVVDLGLEQTRLSPGTSTTRLTSGIDSGSRWGLKGSEDLGGGLSASFQIESGFDASTGEGGGAGGGLMFNRQSWVGLNGGFGSVKLGRQYTPYFSAQGAIDPFGLGFVGDASGMIAVFRHYGVRMNNTINYSTPSFGGFSGEVAYGLGEVAGSHSTGSQFGLQGTYEGGPLTAVAAYHKQGQVAAGADAGDNRSALVGAAYDFKVVKLHGAFADNRDTSAGGATTGRSRDLMLGVSAPVGAATLMASYMQHQDRLASNADSRFWGIGASYPLSKRTNFYSSYSRITNDAGGALGSGAAGVNISWLNFGIRHKF